jgi:DNA repair protein RecN (Recombination protein N)
MLRELNIKDFAIIQDLRVQFDEGLNILTGETGSGKSIIIEALSLLLGDRADADFIRTGHDTASVEGMFDCENFKDNFKFLEQRGIEFDEDRIVVKRIISRSGRNKIYINSSLSNLSVLKKIGDRLVDIHGQHQHQTLLNPENHVFVYDSFNNLTSLRKKYKKLFVNLQVEKAKLNALKKNATENLQKRDLFEFQMKEIDNANLSEKEEDNLKKERVSLQNAGELLNITNNACEEIYSSDHSIIERLNIIFENLSSVASYDERVKKILEETKPSLFLLEEASSALRDYSRNIEINPEKLSEVEDRLSEINELKRKYGNAIHEIFLYREKIGKEHNSLTRNTDNAEALNKKIDLIKKDLAAIAVDLSDKREKALENFGNRVEKELSELNMEGVCFKAHLSYKKDDDSFIKRDGLPVSFSEIGLGSLEFMISPNTGEEPRPLAKIASGGELSRIMLSVKNILATQDTVPIMVFDEVDSGIGGKVAETVGLKLKKISKTKQVFCITHLSQIASLKGAHFRIEKGILKGRTQVKIRRLSEKERIDEIARMSGGDNISQITRKHAKELLDTSKETVAS